MSRVELAKIPSLTFYKDAVTAARRTSPWPQVTCVGNACKLYQPEVVRCVNLGGSGTDIDWKCEADLPESLRFGKVEVNCEGWSRPGDNYVLKAEDWWSTIFWVVWLGILAFIIYRFIASFWAGNGERGLTPRPNTGRPPGYGGGGGSNHGWFPGDHPDYAAPPPPYSKDPPTQEGWRPGFWTGAMVGGLANQLWNRRNDQPREPVQPAQPWGWERARNPFSAPPDRQATFQRRYFDEGDRGEGSSNLEMKSLVALAIVAFATRAFALVPTPVVKARCEETSTTTSAPTPTSVCENATKFKFFGVNQAGAEFGNNVIPGSLGTHYIWPAPSSIDFFVNEGFNTFRVPFQLERLSPPETGLTGPFNEAYLNGLKQSVDYVTKTKDAYIVIEPHNFMIYNGSFITDKDAFAKWWFNLATEFKDNDKVIFDIMNEPHTLEAKVVFELNQAALNAIRETGATQLILVEGTAWTGAWTWTGYSGNGLVFGDISDPLNNTAIEMHQYLDSDGSGTSTVCVSNTIGAERIAEATKWLKERNLKGFLGEMGAGSNPDCIEAVRGALCHLQQSGVWIGFAWWSAGPWWGNYFQSIEPPNGPALAEMYPQAIKPFI
ncbi:hypothetical protein EST38_g214 [Candolleomyces aberdarensis]|uniref:cellulase n=1 Tax=Candolleomyces aberdarensis TaxID=2316362 RepID=A0A4Q2DZ33_9AGAR|nr:hypothetical protein EST38_g214 [Candolleomyces aberdarensis]